MWQHMFQFVVCVPCSVLLHGTQYTHHKLKYMLPQHVDVIKMHGTTIKKHILCSITFFFEIHAVY